MPGFAESFPPIPHGVGKQGLGDDSCPKQHVCKHHPRWERRSSEALDLFWALLPFPSWTAVPTLFLGFLNAVSANFFISSHTLKRRQILFLLSLTHPLGLGTHICSPGTHQTSPTGNMGVLPTSHFTGLLCVKKHKLFLKL